MPLTSDQFASVLVALLRQAARPVAEQRREPRISVSGVVVVLTAGASGEPPIHAHLKDISRGGIGFTHHAGLAKGRRLVLHLPTEAGEPRSIPCEVRHCTLVGDEQYVIGIAFPEEG